MQDITEREATRHELRQLNEKLETLVEARTLGLNDARIKLERVNSDLQERVRERTRKLETANQLLEQSEKKFLTLLDDMNEGFAPRYEPTAKETSTNVRVGVVYLLRTSSLFRIRKFNNTT